MGLHVPWWLGVIELTCSGGTWQGSAGFRPGSTAEWSSVPVQSPSGVPHGNLPFAFSLFSARLVPTARRKVLTGPLTAIRQTVFPVTQTLSEALPMEEPGPWTHGWHLAASPAGSVGRGISAQGAGCQAYSSCCYFPAAQKFFALKRVSLTLERTSLPLEPMWSLRTRYQVSFFSKKSRDNTDHDSFVG